MNKYLVCIAEYAVKNVMISPSKVSAETDYAKEEKWIPFKGELVLGVYKASSEEQAIQICGEHYEIETDNFKAYLLNYE